MLSVQRSTWKPEHLALVCGIANAGGGTLTIASSRGNKLSDVRKAQRFFDTVLRQTQGELGLACSIEPIMVGGHLCAEIMIPAATMPASYNGAHYLWRHGINDRANREDVEQVISAEQKAALGATAKVIAPKGVTSSKKFDELSLAAANNLDLTAIDEQIIKVLTINGRVTARRVAQYLKVSDSTVHRSYRKLRELGIICRIGSKKAGYWKVLV